MGLAFVVMPAVSFLLVFISPELIWAESPGTRSAVTFRHRHRAQSYLWGQIVGPGNNCITWDHAW